MSITVSGVIAHISTTLEFPCHATPLNHTTLNRTTST